MNRTIKLRVVHACTCRRTITVLGLFVTYSRLYSSQCVLSKNLQKKNHKNICRHICLHFVDRIWLTQVVNFKTNIFTFIFKFFFSLIYTDSDANHSHNHAGASISPNGITVHVCMTSDENTVLGMVAAINSIRLNSRHRVRFHLVTNDKAAGHLR